MDESERHRLILDVLAERPFATVQDLLDVLKVSPATIRRDIAKLHETGNVRKVFGGIAAFEHDASPERLAARPFEENRMLAVDAKRAIAREAEMLVRDGDAIIIHGGTTCYLFALRPALRAPVGGRLLPSEPCRRRALSRTRHYLCTRSGPAGFLCLEAVLQRPGH